MRCVRIASEYDAHGLKAEAQEWVDRARQVDPDHPGIWLTILSSYNEEIDDEALKRLETIPTRRSVEGEELAMWHFAVARAYDNRLRFDESWLHYSHANELLNRLRPYDDSVDANHVEAVLSTVGPELFERAPVVDLDQTGGGTPIFVIGFPGSGTTLVEQILASHPEVRGGGEQVVVIRAAVKLTKLGKPGRSYIDLLNRIAPSVLSDLAASAIDEYNERSGPRSRVTDKLPTNYYHVGLIRLLFPDAPIIHVKRDAVDTCVTNYLRMYTKGNNYANSITNLATTWARYERVMKHWHSTMPASSIHDVAYHELVDDQEQVTRQMLDHCGLEWDERCLRFNETRRPVHTASRSAVRLPIYRTSVGRSRRFGHHLDELETELDKQLKARA